MLKKSVKAKLIKNIYYLFIIYFLIALSISIIFDIILKEEINWAFEIIWAAIFGIVFAWVTYKWGLRRRKK